MGNLQILKVKLWVTNLEASKPDVSSVTTEGSTDGLILATRKPIWVPLSKPTPLPVLPTLKVLLSRKSESKLNSQTLLFENASGSNWSRTVKESLLSFPAMVRSTTSKKTMRFSSLVSVVRATPSVISPVSDSRSSKLPTLLYQHSSVVKKKDHEIKKFFLVPRDNKVTLF